MYPFPLLLTDCSEVGEFTKTVELQVRNICRETEQMRLGMTWREKKKANCDMDNELQVTVLWLPLKSRNTIDMDNSCLAQK